MKDAERDAILTNNAGAHYCRRNKQTGHLVTVYNCEEAELSGGPWATVCEKHGFILTHDHVTHALRHLSHPLDWCEECEQESKRKETASEQMD
jgi:hypothetical protein